MDGDPIACARGRGGNFRRCHHHVSALRHRSGFDDCELARIARRLGMRASETVRLLGLSGYLILLLSALASLLKPIVFWRLPEMSGLLPAAGLLQVSATVDATAFIFEYLVGVYIQVYLITVCLAWIRGLSFEEGELFRFAMRRFSYVLEWAGIVVAVSTLILRLPLVLAYFINIPRVLDYLPIARFLMSGLIIAFCSVQISLVLHNETLIEAMRAHVHFIQKMRFVSHGFW